MKKKLLANRIAYRRTRNLPLEQLERLWRAVGWWTAETSPRLLPKALARSHMVVTAWDGEVLVGLGNALSDGHLVVYYPYLLVDPAYQRQGIGTQLLGMMQKRYGALRQQVLISKKDAISFYERRGFAVSDAPGMQIHNADV